MESSENANLIKDRAKILSGCRMDKCGYKKAANKRKPARAIAVRMALQDGERGHGQWYSAASNRKTQYVDVAVSRTDATVKLSSAEEKHKGVSLAPWKVIGTHVALQCAVTAGNA